MVIIKAGCWARSESSLLFRMMVGWLGVNKYWASDTLDAVLPVLILLLSATDPRYVRM